MSRSERVAPIQHYIDPITADAVSATRVVSDVGLAAESEVVARLTYLIAKVSRVVPQDIDTGAHPWRDEIPQIPLSQENRVAMELGNRPANPSLRAQNGARS